MGFPLLLDIINEGACDQVPTLLAYKKFLDMNIRAEGWTALGLAAGSQPKTVHLLLQAGVKVEGFPKDFHHPFTCATLIRHGRHAARNKPKRLATALMLLACGVEPYFHQL